MGFVDLHIHTVYSDSTVTPAEAVRLAADTGVTLMAVCDHNVLTGSVEAQAEAKKVGIVCLPGVEVDCLFLGSDTHVLAYGCDFENAEFVKSVKHARWALDNMSVELLEKLKPEYPQLSLAEYEAFSEDKQAGGWKMLQYMKYKGVVPSLRQGMPLYERYGVTYDKAGFESIGEIVGKIHAAGGKAILAHPGVVFRHYDLPEQLRRIGLAFEAGVDGVECFYPTHTPEQIEEFLLLCREKNGLVTSGSDYHGVFGRTQLGEPYTDETDIRLEY